MGISLQSTTASDKVGMMEETYKAVSTDFIKKSRHLKKLQVENASLCDSLSQQRKEDKAQVSEINCLQSLLAEANTEKGKLQWALNNVGSQLEGQEVTRNVALKESQDKDSKIRQLIATSRDVAQVQIQLREEILLKEGYAHQLSEAQVSQTDERMTFEVKLKAKEVSLEQFGKHVSELETLLQQEQNHTLQLQQIVKTREAKILALENQVAIEQNKIQQLQQEIVGKDNEIS